MLQALRFDSIDSVDTQEKEEELVRRVRSPFEKDRLQLRLSTELEEEGGVESGGEREGIVTSDGRSAVVVAGSTAAAAGAKPDKKNH